MKKRYTLLVAVLLTAGTFGQSPEKISFPYALQATNADNGITAEQATEISENTDKEGYREALVSCVPTWFGGTSLQIGDSYQGGIVFYLDGSGGGLIAATSNQSSGIAWITGESSQSTLNGNTSDLYKESYGGKAIS